MNIFVISFNPKEAAEQHCDKHVIKMILETTQLLYHCWAFFDEDYWRSFIEMELSLNTTLINMQESGQKVNFNTYKSGKGHMNHPCSKWVRESVENYKWLCALGLHLCEEKMHRWPKNKQHSCLGHLEVLSKNIPRELPIIPLTRFALAMPEAYKQESVIHSYHMYYNMEKNKMFEWTNRESPDWIKYENFSIK